MLIYRTSGFTLLELMIAILLMSILTSLAVPAYRENMRQTQRTGAQIALHALSIAMERYATERISPSYVGTTAAAPGSPAATVFVSEAPLTSPDKTYNLLIQSATALTYELRAVPKNSQTGDKCGTYTLTSTGQKGITGGAAGVTWQDCWK